MTTEIAKNPNSSVGASSERGLAKLGDQTMTKAGPGKLEPSDLAAAFLRLALGAGFLSAVADRLGFWGPPGSFLVSWGNFHNFLVYTAKLTPWCPSAGLPLLGVVVTIAEAGLGILLILGIATRVAALLTGMLTLAFAAAMTLMLGVHAPLIYSVFAFSAGAVLLASQPPDKLSIDHFRELKSRRKERKEHPLAN
jgi:putative oxidoreductase